MHQAPQVVTAKSTAQKNGPSFSVPSVIGKMSKPVQSYGLCRDEGRDSIMERYLLRHEVEFITRFLGDAIWPRRLLDICCGSGHVTQPLHDTGLEVVGLDIDPMALTLFRRLSNSVPLVQGDALRLPIADSGLDCVVAIHCFDHLDRIQFLQECHRVLCSGGLLIFDSLNRHSYKLPLKHLRHRASIKSHPGFLDKYVNVFSWSEAQQALAGAGFDLLAVSGYGWIPFTVNTRSIRVNTFAWVEQVLRLDRFPSVSPRVLAAVRKRVDR
jgi:SAM-dependent methyltransferase